jgi:hypothetical protein
MVKGQLPPQQYRWLKNDLSAGELLCRVCGGNRLAPSQWWPVTAVSLLLIALTGCTIGALVIALWRTAGTPPAAAPTDRVPAASTPAPAETRDERTLFRSPVSVPPDQARTPTQPPTYTPAPTRTATPEPTATATPEPTVTATAEPTATAAPEPTAAATPEPTNTPTSEARNTPEPSSTATPAPARTATPTPMPGPDPGFRAERTTITAGECTVLRWDVDGVRAVFLDGAGRPGHSSEIICPELSHTYTLQVVASDGRQASYALDIRVLGYVPLTLNVFVRNRTCDMAESYAAEIAVWAQGGDGWYTYYRDDLGRQIAGPTQGGVVHWISWRTCGGAVGTFIVRSGDGQEVRQSFWVEPPDCCRQD